MPSLIPIPMQDGQRLPTKVLGIVAKYLTAEAQDRACANLNETSRSLYEETLKDLWSVIRVRSQQRAPLIASRILHLPKAQSISSTLASGLRTGLSICPLVIGS